jgi:E3 ubiquitin-protein ligase RAD18
MNNDRDTFEVSDPSDWLTTPLSGLAPVESALRCQVCKDFYKTPMLTSCNHTFCSLCIRRALSNDGKCPLCRANEQEIRLRSNWAMEEVVSAFSGTRTSVLEFAREPPSTAAATIATNAESPKRKLNVQQSEESREPKRVRTSVRLSASRGAQVTSEMARQEADLVSVGPQEMDYDDGLVACPICLTRMKESQVDRHLDTSCSGSPRPEAQRPQTAKDQAILTHSYQSLVSNPVPRRPDRLPAMNYSMLREPQLRKKLSELGISSNGPRQILERRHKEWVTIWNANCDSLYPRKKSDLLHDLQVWENTLGSRAPTNSRASTIGAQIKDKNFDQQAWSSRHDASFRDLIASARRNVTKSKQIETEKTPSDEADRPESSHHPEEGPAGSGAQAVPVSANKRAGTSADPIDLGEKPTE